MYEETFRALMRYELTVILIMLAIVIFFSVMLYVIVLRSSEKKKQPPKKKQKKEDADGEQIEIEYSHHINKYQEHGKKLEEDTYYTGTIVYSPSSDYLLCWDAVPIE